MFMLSLLPLLDLALLEAGRRVLMMRLCTFRLLGDFVAAGRGGERWGGMGRGEAGSNGEDMWGGWDGN